jgi:hypothetical protein
MVNATSGNAVYSFDNKNLRKWKLRVDDDGDDDDNGDDDKNNALVCAIKHNAMKTHCVIGS